MPIFPQQSDSDAAPPSPLDLLMYAIAGAICGGLGGIAVASCQVAYDTLGLGIPSVDFVHLLSKCVVAGTCIGSCGGFFLWVTVFFWSGARHPARCSAICASLGGSALMLLAACTFNEETDIREMLAALASVVVALACYGFATSLLVRAAHGIIASDSVKVHHDKIR